MTQKRLRNYFNTIINNNRLAHAYLLVGPLGSGKVDLAKWIAQKLFCLEVDSPCQRCVNCQRIAHNEFLDVVVIEPTGLSIKAEQIRQLKTDTAFSSLENDKKVYIISQADKMSVSASNSLLKMMEEPDGMRYFLLLTDKVDDILPTVISRTQLLMCDKTRPNEITEYLLSQQVNGQISYLIAHLTQSKEQAINMASDEFVTFSQSILHWGDLLLKRNMQAFIYVQRQLVQQFSDKAMVLVGLDILFLLFSDLFKTQTISTWITPLTEKKEKRTVVQNDIDSVLQAKKMMQENVASQVCYEWLVLQICGR